jgi:hypothetical protein
VCEIAVADRPAGVYCCSIRQTKIELLVKMKLRLIIRSLVLLLVLCGCLPTRLYDFSQRVNLTVGKDYLCLVVWDARTGRTGTLNPSVDVKKPKRVKR